MVAKAIIIFMNDGTESTKLFSQHPSVILAEKLGVDPQYLLYQVRKLLN